MRNHLHEIVLRNQLIEKEKQERHDWSNLSREDIKALPPNLRIIAEGQKKAAVLKASGYDTYKIKSDTEDRIEGCLGCISLLLIIGAIILWQVIF
ncbi:MAG: hypothetical protein DLD55_05745 [candidate division SR1 bacterium]|nr:MAG: hypothetical protein DLD55_05745 [candidate division SR1 bacterium]